MKKQKTVKPFFFKDHTHQEVCDIINKEYPIKLKYSQDLINRISDRYPLISKSDISYTVKMIFEGMRDFLILGKVLNFNTLFFDTKLFFYSKHYKGDIIPAVKVKISTPPPMRKNV